MEQPKNPYTEISHWYRSLSVVEKTTPAWVEQYRLEGLRAGWDEGYIAGVTECTEIILKTNDEVVR